MNFPIISKSSRSSTINRSAIIQSYGQIFDLSNLVTLFGLLCGLLAMVVAQVSPNWAMLGLMMAGGADGLDGWIARRQNRTAWQNAIGKQLDSFVDLCCFGWVPLVILVMLGYQDSIDYGVMMFYLICAVIRLAIFNCIGLQIINQRPYFVGLPVTSMALILPIGWLVAQYLPEGWREGWLMGLLAIVAVLLLAPVAIPKPQGKLGLFIGGLFGIVALIYLVR
jgi:CDP-diacylglycerol---serine O-phosphatidyltransferase